MPAPGEPVRWLVVFKRDTEPVEVYGYGSSEESEAMAHYGSLRDNWTEVWISEVVEGPGPDGLYRRPS